jgi:glycosyltransferase involved in cell wall biosynthesis
MIAKWTLRRAALVTSNNAYMAERIVALGAAPAKVHVITLGADRYDLARAADSVNRLGHDAMRPRDDSRALTVISTRAHEPLYNIDDVIDAFARVAKGRADVRLVVAHSGSQTAELQGRAAALPARVEFTGFLDRAAFRDALAGAEIFVSVPSSDATSVALLQAMAAGAFPIVSDLRSQRELVEDNINGYRVPPHRPDVLADRIRQALDHPEMRRAAADRNLRIVEERGLNETQMARLEALYLELARR